MANTHALKYVTAALALVLSCAHQMVPGGGDDDRTGPSVVSVSPQPGQTGVSRETTVEIVFSEWIAPAAAARSVTIFPTPRGKYRVRVDGKKLGIRITGGLADSTTYHVVLTSTLNDLRQNPLATPYHLVFSTGPTLDSGTVGGCVIDQGRQQVQPRIALFREDLVVADSTLFGLPDYLTQTDSFGTFTLDHIRPGRYRIIGYNDANGDSRLQPATEQAYSPVDSVVSVAPHADSLLLFPAAADTIRPALTSLRPLSSTAIQGKWSKVFADFWKLRIDEWVLEQVDRKVSVRVRDYTLLPNKIDFILRTTDSMQFAGYRLIATFAGQDTFRSTDTLRFNGVGSPDTVPPRLQTWLPAGAVDLRPEFRLSWSEPVTFSERSLQMTDSLGDTVQMLLDKVLSDTSRLVPSRNLRAGRTYMLALARTGVRDVAGNSAAVHDTTDSGRITIRAVVLPADSFAVLLSGGAECLGSHPNRIWLFSPLIKGFGPYASADNAGMFRFDSIPGGKGTLSIVDDLNGNRRADPGHLAPWRAPERIIPLPDTVEARARWEAEGIATPGLCAPCLRRVSPPAAP